MAHPNKQIMQRAIELAADNYRQGGHAVGAIIVKDDTIISEACTTVIRDIDPTAHAEINAIRKAAVELGSRYLEGCYLHTTFEPCPMCSSAAVWSKLQGIVYGASRLDEIPHVASWRIQIPCKTIIEHGTPKLELVEEFMREQCRELLTIV